MKNIFFFIFFLTSLTSTCQSQTKKEVSYTTENEYNKQIKKFPFLKSREAIRDSSIIENENIEYFNTQNERKLVLDSYQLKSKQNLPALILIHGGGWISGNKSMLKPLAQQICLKGYNCFSVDYSLSNEAQYPTSINEVLEAIKYIKKNAATFQVDTLKIAVLGCSSGGQMASLIGTKYPNLVQAVIDIDGVLAFHHPQSSEGTLAAKWLGGTYTEVPEIWDDASALTHTSKNSPPFLFINSQYERFHAGRDDMIKILNQYNIYNKTETIENSPHTFWLFEPWFEDVVQFSTNFLDKTLKQK